MINNHNNFSTFLNSIVIFLTLILIITSCNQSENLDSRKKIIDSIKAKSDFLVIEHNSDQSIDSIIIFRSGEVMSTGQPIYTITTRAEKRKSDSTSEAMKKSLPNPFAPPTLGLNYSLKEESDMKITVLDSMGSELATLFSQSLKPGDYEVRFEIYSVLKPGVYFKEVKSKEFYYMRKLIIK